MPQLTLSSGMLSSCQKPTLRMPVASYDFMSKQLEWALVTVSYECPMAANKQRFTKYVCTQTTHTTMERCEWNIASLTSPSKVGAYKIYMCSKHTRCYVDDFKMSVCSPVNRNEWMIHSHCTRMVHILICIDKVENNIKNVSFSLFLPGICLLTWWALCSLSFCLFSTLGSFRLFAFNIFFSLQLCCLV